MAPFNFFGNVQYDGAGMIEDFGFVVSSGISLDKSKSTVYWVRGVGEPNDFSSKRVRVLSRMFSISGLGHEIMLDTESVLSKLKIPEAPQIWWGEITDEIGEWKILRLVWSCLNTMKKVGFFIRDWVGFSHHQIKSGWGLVMESEPRMVVDQGRRLALSIQASIQRLALFHYYDKGEICPL